MKRTLKPEQILLAIGDHGNVQLAPFSTSAALPDYYVSTTWEPCGLDAVQALVAAGLLEDDGRGRYVRRREMALPESAFFDNCKEVAMKTGGSNG